MPLPEGLDLSQLLDALPDAVVCVRSDGTIAFANAQAAALFGYEDGALAGQPVDALVPDAARAVHSGHRSDYFANPRRRPMGSGIQLTARRRDGTTFPADISLGALETPAGRLAVAAVRDVTDRIEAEAERERLRAEAERERLEAREHQSQRLESLGQLAGGVAHDFNNLLGAVLIYAGFIREALDAAAREGDSERWAPVIADLAQIDRASRRATDLTRQLLTFGRRDLVRPRPLDLNEVVADIDHLLRRTLGEHIELVTTRGPDLWPVMADPGQIEQVLVNLAVNARDAMPQGGTLSIDTANIDVDAAYGTSHGPLAPGPWVRLRVNDSGTGMDGDTISHAFEPFFTTKPKGAGTGLGLATVYGIVAQSGGTVAIYSEVGFGTTIVAHLPATSEEAVVPAPAASPARHRGGESVLVVEDDDAMREVTRRILERNGYSVMAVTDGQAAIAAAANAAKPIDLVLTDVVMPRMQGHEVAEAIRPLQPDAAIMFMSGFAQPIIAGRGTLPPDITLLEKPFTEATLLAHIRDALDGVRR